METKPKLVFFDLDGTLVGKNGKISDQDQMSLQRLKSEGIKIAIASGRSVMGIQAINALISFNALSSLAAGSVIYDPQGSSVIEVAAFTPTKAKKIWDVLKEYEFYREAYTVTDTFITAPHQFADIHGEYMDVPPTVVTEDYIFTANQDGYYPNQIIKLEVIVDSADELSRLHAVLANVPEIMVSVASGAKHPSIYFINITDFVADRNRTFERILEIENVSAAEVLSFGDSESDRIFIQRAGVGVAMSNAPEAVKSAAKVIADSVEQSGVSKALKQLVFDRL